MTYAHPRSHAIGKKIRNRRQVLGMTQQDLADLLKVAKSTVSNWESGKHFPLRYLGAVEHVLGISLEDDQPPAPRPPAPSTQRMFNALPPEERDWFLAEWEKINEGRRREEAEPDAQPEDEAC